MRKKIQNYSYKNSYFYHVSRFNYENQFFFFFFWYHQKSITIKLLKSYNIWDNIWYIFILVPFIVSCFRDLCVIYWSWILKFCKTVSFICDIFWDLEVLQNIQKTCESVIFSSFAHWRTATCTAHMWLIFRFCNETIHTESESTPHFLIFNAHKSFIDIILYPLLKNFCFKFIFLDLSRSNNENNGKYLLQLI